MEKVRFKKIYIEITNICNLNCSFCPDTNREKTFMSTINFEKVLKQISKHTNLIALHVKGEPLMYPELEEILLLCEKYNLKVNITTNGTLLYENKEVLSKSKALRQLNISLHSLNKNTGIDKEKYLKKIFETADLLNVYISYRLWNLKNIRENSDNYFILKELSRKYNINSLENLAKENEFVKLKENVFLNQDIEFEWPNINGEIISENGTCLGLREQVAILVNGDVVPCCLDQNGDIKLGNIFEEDFSNIIDSEFSKKIIRGFEENKLIHNLCKKCGYRKVKKWD